MTTSLPSSFSGGSPERRSGSVTVEQRMSSLQRQIGGKACEFMGAVSYLNPFSHVFTETEVGIITERAILRSVGIISLSGIPNDELYEENDGRLVGDYSGFYLSDQSFKNGVRLMRSWVVSLRPFIEGKSDYTLSFNKQLTVEGIPMPYEALGSHLRYDPRGLSLVEALGRDLQRGYFHSSPPSIREGIRFGADLFASACTFYTEPHMEQLIVLQRAVRFLGTTDDLIARFGPVPYDDLV